MYDARLAVSVVCKIASSTGWIDTKIWIIQWRISCI